MSALATSERFGAEYYFSINWRSRRHCLQSEWPLVLLLHHIWFVTFQYYISGADQLYVFVHKERLNNINVKICNTICDKVTELAYSFQIHLFFMRWLFVYCLFWCEGRMSEYFYRAWSSGLQPASFNSMTRQGSLRWKQKSLLPQPVASLTPQPFRNCASKLFVLYSIFVCLAFHLLGL